MDFLFFKNKFTRVFFVVENDKIFAHLLQIHVYIFLLIVPLFEI